MFVELFSNKIKFKPIKKTQGFERAFCMQSKKTRVLYDPKYCFSVDIVLELLEPGPDAGCSIK